MIEKFNYRIIICSLIVGLVSFRLFSASDGLSGYLLAAFGLGLRHGLDADHIVVIDNISRKLIYEGKTASSTGLFFALGHSTIVFIMTLAVIFGLNHFQSYFGKIAEFGNNFGSIISIIFLSITLTLNLLMIQAVYQKDRIHSHIPNSLGYRIYKHYFFYSIDNSQKMYFIGFLFGLGFDTASEIGLLALAATSLFKGISIYLVLFLPLGFTCGMMITDTINSTFMSSIYSQIQKNQQRLKLYNLLILGFASLVTLLVILIELGGYLEDKFAAHLSLPTMINKLANYSEIIGSSIVSVFIVLGLVIYSILMSKKKC